MFKMSVDSESVSKDTVSRFIRPGHNIGLRGTITDFPKLGESSIRFVVDAETVITGGRILETSGEVFVSILLTDLDSSSVDSVVYGRKVALSGELVSAGRARNPGEFDLMRYYQINNICARLLCDRSSRLSLGAIQTDFLSTVVFPVRNSLAHRFDRLVGGEESAFLKGLIIGDRSGIPIELKNAFVNAGVMHIIAVAGLHVGMVAFIVSLVFTVLRIPKRPRLILLGISLVFYLFLTGAAHPVIRAVIMALVILGGALWERRPDVHNSLAIAAIILLLIDAKNLFQPGFQLSFSAVFFIVYLYPYCTSISNVLPERVRRNGLAKAIVALVGVSLSAAIGTLPFTSMYFGKISIIGLIANLIIVPMAGLVLALGVTTAACSFVSTWCASVYAGTTKVVTHTFLNIVSYFGNLSFSYIDSHFTLWSLLAFYAVVVFVVNIRNRVIVRRFIFAFLLVANIVWYRWVLTGESDKLRVTFLDVGQGDAAFIEFPGGRNLLLDAGPRTESSDAGSRFIEPFLRQKGIHRINAILISHPHSDHLGGVPYLMRRFGVDEVIDAGSAGNSSLFGEYIHLVDSLEVTRTILRAGTAIGGFGDVRLYALHPSGDFVPVDSGEGINLNNQSIVVKLVYGASTVLFSGDAEREAEERMRNQYGDFLRCDVLKTGHHGSITSSTLNYIQVVRPATAIVSVGVKNKFHHPSRVVLTRLAQTGAKYYRTDESGAIVLESDGSAWSVIDWQEVGRFAW